MDDDHLRTQFLQVTKSFNEKYHTYSLIYKSFIFRNYCQLLNLRRMLKYVKQEYVVTHEKKNIILLMILTLKPV